jgi:ribosomal protein S18 acetylase RimI-like enzyme
MNSVEIIAVTLNDLAVLQKIGIETFYESFSSVNTEENMTQYLAEAYSLEKLTDELNSPNSSFYFAVVNDKIIGYLKINFGDSQTELKLENALEIERIYVLKEYHGKNIGQLLFEKAMELAIQKKADYVWLGVWEENPRAISFYKKNGFVEFDKHIFRLGDDEQTDIMMKLQLKNS